jgi:hypothetical protein
MQAVAPTPVSTMAGITSTGFSLHENTDAAYGATSSQLEVKG